MADSKALNGLRFRLEQYRITVAQKKELELQLREIEETLGAKAMSYDSIGGSSGKVTKLTENQAMELINKKQGLIMTLNHKGLEVDRIENAIRVLNPAEKEIINLKHLQGHRWETVYYMLKKSDKTCRVLEKKALEKMLEILNYSVDAAI